MALPFIHATTCIRSMTCKYESVQTAAFHSPRIQLSCKSSPATSSDKRQLYSLATQVQRKRPFWLQLCLRAPIAFARSPLSLFLTELLNCFLLSFFPYYFVAFNFRSCPFFPGFCILVSGIILSYLDPIFAPYMKKVSSGSRKENRNKGKIKKWKGNKTH